MYNERTENNSFREQFLYAKNYNQPCEVGVTITSHFIQAEIGTERLSNLLKVTQLASDSPDPGLSAKLGA